MDTAPSWAAPALLAAAIAALGFVGKMLVDLVVQLRDAKRERKSRLTELRALMRAGDTAFLVQCALRDKLARRLRRRSPELSKVKGYSRLFAAAFPTMNARDKELFGLIRNITVHTLRPLNDALLAWLRADTYFRGASPSDRRYGELAQFLAHLEAHLLLWSAKYAAWIPSHPYHALVYMRDEQRHGVGFPPNGARLLAKALDHPVD